MVDKQVGLVSFGLFSVDEVHAISVKKLTNFELFDDLRKPVSDGLYDPALGPLEQKQRSC